MIPSTVEAGRFPAKVEHVAGPLESKPASEFGRDVRLWRQGCACGHRGMWYSQPGYAIESFARHFNRSGR